VAALPDTWPEDASSPTAAVWTRGITTWTLLIGMISCELFGHYVGTVDPSDAFFAHTVELMADLSGLPAGH
jgi:hypothetical protein